MRLTASVTAIVLSAIVAGTWFSGSALKAEDAKGFTLDLSTVDGFPVTIQAPAGAQAKDDFGDAAVRSGEKFQLQIHPRKTDLTATKKEIVANTLNKLKQFVIESDDVLLYESSVAGQSEFHFMANLTVGEKTFSAEDNKGPVYSKAEVEQMLASFKTLAAKK